MKTRSTPGLNLLSNNGSLGNKRETEIKLREKCTTLPRNCWNTRCIMAVVFPLNSSGLLTRMCDYLVSCQMHKWLIPWPFVLWLEGTRNKMQAWIFATRVISGFAWDETAAYAEVASSGPLVSTGRLRFFTGSFCPCGLKGGSRVWVIYEDGRKGHAVDAGVTCGGGVNRIRTSERQSSVRSRGQNCTPRASSWQGNEI